MLTPEQESQLDDLIFETINPALTEDLCINFDDEDTLEEAREYLRNNI